MLTIEQKGPREWSFNYGDKDPIVIRLQTSSITNKFSIITEFIEMLNKKFSDFGEWFFNFLNECQDIETREDTVMKNINIIKKYVDEYIDTCDVDFSTFVDESKAKKSSILFSVAEIIEIIKLSGYLKIYSVLFNSEEVSLGRRVHKEVYNEFASKTIEMGIASKILDLIKAKTFSFNLTDKFMWDYVKNVKAKDLDTHIIEIFNYIMRDIVVLCEINKNPITFFIGVSNSHVLWTLRGVYKHSEVYNDEISTEDIHAIHINNLKLYSFNHTLGKLKGIAFEKVYDKLERMHLLSIGEGDTKADQHLVDFNKRITEIEHISPLCPSLVFPVLAKVTGVSYIHFKTISPEHSAVLSYYTNTIFSKVFRGEFRHLFQLLDYYPLSQPSMSTTYQIKNVHEYLDIQNKTQNFFGFNAKSFPYKVICQFVGLVSRINFCNLLTGQKMSGIPLSKIESDMIKFYTLFFANELDNKIQNMKSLIVSDF